MNFSHMDFLPFVLILLITLSADLLSHFCYLLSSPSVGESGYEAVVHVVEKERRNMHYW